MACASPAYLRARGTPGTPADLAHHDCLGYAYSTRAAERTWRFTRNGKIYAVEVKYRLEANGGTPLKAAAIEGAGVLIAAEDTLRGAIKDGRLMRVLPDYEPSSRPFHLLYPRDHRQTPKLARFITLAVAVFGADRKAIS